MQTDLNIELLRTFVSVVDHGSFTHASESLFLSQPAVSHKVKKLEDLFGKKLLQRRQGRFVGVTEDGENLLTHAREMLKLNDLALSSINYSGIEGSLGLGLTDDFIELHLPHILAQYTRNHPKVRLNVRCDLSRKLQIAVQNGSLDAALIKQPVGSGTSTPLFCEPMVWVGNLKHSPSAKTPLPLLLYAEGCSYREQSIAALAQAGVPWRVAFTCSSLAGIQAGVIGGLGIAALPLSSTTGLPLCESPTLPEIGASELALIVGEKAKSNALDSLIVCIHECLAQSARKQAA